MKKDLIPAQRLVVAADYKEPHKVLELAKQLKGTNITLKVNSALRFKGYDLISTIRDYRLGVFADLKLVDIPETLGIDGSLLARLQPEILTVMCNTGTAGIKKLKEQLPNTEVLGVTVLTTMSAQDCWDVYGATIEQGVQRFSRLAKQGGADGLILAPKDVVMLKQAGELPEGLSLNCPGIRPEWVEVTGDDQKGSYHDAARSDSRWR